MAHELVTDQNQRVQVPFFPYILFHLYLEPVSAVAGAFLAAFKPGDYLFLMGQLAGPSSNGATTTQQPRGARDTPTLISLAQLGNFFLLITLAERLVLARTRSLSIWRSLLTCFLVADLGHLASMARLGPGVFWRVWEWNEMGWAGVGLVYVSIVLRVAFLCGVGFVVRMDVGGRWKFD